MYYYKQVYYRKTCINQKLFAHIIYVYLSSQQEKKVKFDKTKISLKFIHHALNNENQIHYNFFKLLLLN